MRVYFDYNATTPLSPEAAESVILATRDLFGNASSVHHFGQQAKAALDDTRSAVAALLNADPSEVVFTSGGTESDNFAIRGAAEALESGGRKHLIASVIGGLIGFAGSPLSLLAVVSGGAAIPRVVGRGGFRHARG